MSDDSLTSAAAPRPDDAAHAPAPGGAGVLLAARPLPDGTGPGTWHLGWTGVRTVAVLELRQRIRSTRWTAVLALWTGVLALLTILVRWAVHRIYDESFEGEGLGPGADEAAARLADQVAGRLTFGIIVFLVLSLAGLVSPALSATSINGDRQAGVLATLQTTLLSPAQIVVGKLLAAWVTGLALLAAALPFIGWIYLDGGTPFGRLAVVVVVLALTILVVCAIGLGWSAITARTSSSAVLTYLTVAFLGPGLPLLFALSVPLVTENTSVAVRQQVYNAEGAPTGCRVAQEERTITYTNRSWWLLAASPYVVVADASPKPLTENGSDDPMTLIRDSVREARLGPRFPLEECYEDLARSQQFDRERQAQRESLGATWPYGLAADLALGGLFVVVAVRRLRTPTRRLPTGTRVA
jgi:ABC-type transport system involved in multi-copper enzyme maturation permease subunit